MQCTFSFGKPAASFFRRTAFAAKKHALLTQHSFPATLAASHSYLVPFLARRERDSEYEDRLWTIEFPAHG